MFTAVEVPVTVTEDRRACFMGGGGGARDEAGSAGDRGQRIFHSLTAPK